MISEKSRFLYENNRSYKSYKCSNKFTFISFLSFRRNQKQELNFQQVGGLVTRSSFAFCLQRVVLHFEDMPNSVDFYKRIFLHVIPVRMIVPWFQIVAMVNFLKQSLCAPPINTFKQETLETLLIFVLDFVFRLRQIPNLWQLNQSKDSKNRTPLNFPKISYSGNWLYCSMHHVRFILTYVDKNLGVNQKNQIN